MRTRSAAALTPAERARTLLASTSNVRLQLPDLTLDVHRHGLTPDGALLFSAPPDLALGTAEVVAIDVAAVPQPDRVRGEVRLRGILAEAEDQLPAGMRTHLTGAETPGTARLVRLTPAGVSVRWGRRALSQPAEHATTVAISAYRAAYPDPLVGHEALWLAHLQADHADVITALARAELGVEGAVDARAWALDRYGLVLRIGDTEGPFELRIGFERPAACGCEAREAFSALAARAGLGPVC